jgi:hypothetical protein
MALQPLRPAKIDYRTCWRLGMKGCGLQSDDATGGVAAAFEVDEGNTFDGKIALDCAGNACGLI